MEVNLLFRWCRSSRETTGYHAVNPPGCRRPGNDFSGGTWARSIGWSHGKAGCDSCSGGQFPSTSVARPGNGLGNIRRDPGKGPLTVFGR